MLQRVRAIARRLRGSAEGGSDPPQSAVRATGQTSWHPGAARAALRGSGKGGRGGNARRRKIAMGFARQPRFSRLRVTGHLRRPRLVLPSSLTETGRAGKTRGRGVAPFAQTATFRVRLRPRTSFEFVRARKPDFRQSLSLCRVVGDDQLPNRRIGKQRRRPLACAVCGERQGQGRAGGGVAAVTSEERARGAKARLFGFERERCGRRIGFAV